MSTMAAQPLTGSAAWHRRDLARSTDWIRPISVAAVAELDTALAAVKARGLAWADITRKDSAPRGGAGARRGRSRAEHG
jgi:hypothetical protein